MSTDKRAAARSNEWTFGNRPSGAGETDAIKTTVLLCGPPLLAVGGGPTHVRNMFASSLAERYRLVHWETGSRGTESPAKDETARTKTVRLVTSPYVLMWKILFVRPTVVHLNTALNSRAFWRDAVYLFIAKSLGRKVVLQLHGGSLKDLCRSRWLTPIVRKVFAAADAVVLLANCEKSDFEGLGIKGRFAVIPNAVNTAEYGEAGKRVHSGKVQRLVFLGRLIRAKGVFEAIEAVEILRTDPRFNNIELQIAGSGPALEEIEKRIKERSLDAYVKLVGPLFGGEKIKFLQEADVFLFPSYHTEGLPYTVLESLAAGTPVVTTRAGGIPEVVHDRVHGMLIAPRNVDDLINAVKELARSQDALRKMSTNCVKWAERELGLERFARQISELYEEVRLPDGARARTI